MIKKLLPYRAVLIHILVWALFFSFVVVSMFHKYPALSFGLYLLLQVLILIEMLVVFYINYIFIAPRLFAERRLLSFINLGRVILLFVLGYCFSLIVRVLGASIKSESLTFLEIAESSLESLGAILFFFILSTIVRLSKSYNDSKLKESELLQVIQQAELEALKAKTNPHFLYNAFNTLYALSEIKSDLMSGAILKLSNIMRYLLSNSSHAKVSINEELGFIQDFIDFQKLRINDPEKKVITNIQEPPSDFLITPTLLISFVENAFKHSNMVKEDNTINIDFKVDSNGFTYYVTNNIYRTGETDSGIGNKNLKKILDIEYGNDYELKTWSEDDIFHAYLSIQNI